jgi:hypothetical protein
MMEAVSTSETSLYSYETTWRYIPEDSHVHENISVRYPATWSRVSSGSIVSDYGLDDRAIGVRSPGGGGKGFFL